MPLKYNGTTINKVVYNGTNVTKVIYNGVEVWTAKPSTFSINVTGISDDISVYFNYKYRGTVTASVTGKWSGSNTSTSETVEDVLIFCGSGPGIRNVTVEGGEFNIGTIGVTSREAWFSTLPGETSLDNQITSKNLSSNYNPNL